MHRHTWCGVRRGLYVIAHQMSDGYPSAKQPERANFNRDTHKASTSGVVASHVVDSLVEVADTVTEPNANGL
jgi:hypothetical protein